MSTRPRRAVLGTAVAALALGGYVSASQFAPGSRADPLPRATTDRPDDVAGPQIHVVYAVPADAADRRLDTDGTLARSVAAWNAWLAGQTGGRGLRLDTSGGALDVTFVRLAETDAQIETQGAYVRDELERELHALGFDQAGKIYAVYYDGHSSWSCGGGAWPPLLQGDVAALYLHGLYSQPIPCDSNAFGTVGQPGYLEFAMLHEIFHTLGFVPTCAPHQLNGGHVNDSPADLMWQGAAPWRPSALDVGHDDYYNAHIPGCLDFADSPYLTTVVTATTATTAATSPTTATAATTVAPAPTKRKRLPLCHRGHRSTKAHPCRRR
ncbi:MAG: hypothetical protein ACYDA3_02150 [Gaiellaceae bacterium]